jgi:DMSO/TMAO reductase YedYZ molybdopterin-dependent catalytic subunit
VAVPVDAGLHVGLGLVIIPVVLAKLWSVIPRLFAWPPAPSLAQLLERVTLLMLVGGILFEIVTGILNIQYDYVFGFDFYTAHYFGAWVFIAGFVCHLCLKLPTMERSLRSRSMRSVLGTSRADTVPELPDPTGLVALDPDPPTLSRRGALALVGGGTLLVAVLTAGQTVGGFTRSAALLLPRGRSYGNGPNDFQINRTACARARGAVLLMPAIWASFNPGSFWVPMRLTSTSGTSGKASPVARSPDSAWPVRFEPGRGCLLIIGA